MIRVLVTGANGQIGANTIRSLLRRGYQVIPFVRPTSDLRGIAKLGLEYRYGDVMNCASLTDAARGCDVIIHHAAVYRTWAKSPEEILRPALVGTRNVFQAAKENGVRRVIYTSSVAAVGSLQRPAGALTEANWNEDPRMAYMIAKTESEREAVRLSEELDIPTVRLCPCTVSGPYDYRITPSTKEILDLVNNTGPTYETGANHVHVYDVGEVHAAAVEAGSAGSRYLVGGTNLHMKELGALVGKFTGVTPKHLGVSSPVAQLGAGIVAWASKITGSVPPFDREMAHDMVGRYLYCDCSLARQTFGIVPRGAEEVVRDTIRWLLFLGKIKPQVAERLASTCPPDPDWL